MAPGTLVRLVTTPSMESLLSPGAPSRLDHAMTRLSSTPNQWSSARRAN